MKNKTANMSEAELLEAIVNRVVATTFKCYTTTVTKNSSKPVRFNENDCANIQACAMVELNKIMSNTGATVYDLTSPTIQLCKAVNNAFESNGYHDLYAWYLIQGLEAAQNLFPTEVPQTAS
jgi:hypothetical protein